MWILYRAFYVKGQLGPTDSNDQTFFGVHAIVYKAVSESEAKAGVAYPRLGQGLLQKHGACMVSDREAAAAKLASELCPSGICWQHWAFPAAEG